MLSSPTVPALSSIFAGLNVALATAACAVCAIKGHPEMVMPVCGMVTGVYGVYGIATSVQTLISRRNDKRDESAGRDE